MFGATVVTVCVRHASARMLLEEWPDSAARGPRKGAGRELKDKCGLKAVLVVMNNGEIQV